MTESIYQEYNIDPNKLSRDYINEPLKKRAVGVPSEKPTKEDLLYLYIELNLSMEQLKVFFGYSSMIGYYIKYHNIKKSKHLVSENRIKTNLKKYGRSNVGQFGSPEHKKAIKEKYGCANVFQNEKIKEKMKATCLERYDEEHYFKTDVFKEKTKITCLERYGVKHNGYVKE